MPCLLFRDMNIRVGNGFDTHPLVKGRPFILGGINIPSDLGIKGHSDGDALIHSIMDSILGALSKKDIGYYFPSNSNEFKNIESSKLLSKVDEILKKEGYKILNIDSTVILEYPHIGKYTDLMIDNISKILQLESNQVSVKATTNDGLGFIGESKGVSVITTSLVIKK
tara:strand:+ start:995 stop:1498 length:504 start_codon:yes stop_codon:yes gene_type:complete